MNLQHYFGALARALRRFIFTGGEHCGRDLTTQLVRD
jgi:hypothetical protein